MKKLFIFFLLLLAVSTKAQQPVNVVNSISIPVTGTFWQTTQPVSGTFFQTT